jgi:RHS repeat-associated protein
MQLLAATLLLLVPGFYSASAQATASITVNGSEQGSGNSWDTSTITVAFNGFTESVSYGQYSSTYSVASAFAAMFSRDYSQYGLFSGVAVDGAGQNVVAFELQNGPFAPVTITDSNTSFSMSASGFSAQALPTTTALSASSTSPVVGTNVVLTAILSPSSATGTVTFKDGGTVVGTGTRSGGMATYTVSAITPGTHSYTASFGGDSSYNASTSSAVTVTTQNPPTVTTLSASNTTPAVGTSVTLTANVAPSAATGTVTFLDGSTTLGTGALSGGVATYTVSAITLGTHSYTASYGGNSSYSSSTSSALTVTGTCGANCTVSAMWSDNSPSSTGSNVNLSAVITSDHLYLNDSPPDSPPSGTVAFFDGTSSLGTATVGLVPENNWLFASELIDPEDFNWNFFDDNGSWHSIVTESAADPSGTTNATQIAAQGPGYSYVTQETENFQTPNDTGSFTSSIWLRSDNPAACGGLELGAYGYDQTDGNLSTPAIVKTWQRYSTSAAASALDEGEFYLAIPSGCTVSMWGAQLESGSSMGPYQYETHDGFFAPNISTATLSTTALSQGVHSITAVYSGDQYNLGSSATFTQYMGVSGTTTIFDSGTVTLTVDGISGPQVHYGNGSTGSSIAQALAASYPQTGSPVSVTASQNWLMMFATQSGADTNYPYSITMTYDTADFSAPSFSFDSTTTGASSGNLVGGSTSGVTPIYTYSVPDPTPTTGYDANGNVLSYTDSVMGQWSFGYDQLNRLTTATNGHAPVALAGSPSWSAPAPGWAANFCWAYDSFGNRLAQSTSNVAFSTANGSCATSGTLYQNVIASYDSNNRMTSTNAPGMTLQPPGYDASGDITNDGKNAYMYDAEGRICAETNLTTGVSVGYLYDAEGRRVGKGTIQPELMYSSTTNTYGQALTCDMIANGYSQTDEYVVGPSGEQWVELDGGNNWKHTNLYAGGKLIGTEDNYGLHFHIDDPLGTRRAQANSSGALEAVYQSLPFGDGYAEAAGAGVSDPTENHFTGKERDAESGNDYMFARYYNSATGRFLSPDWDAKSDDPVPYADLDDPQSLNLYSYVRNNPVTTEDPNGHWPAVLTKVGVDIAETAEAAGEAISLVPAAAIAGAGWVVNELVDPSHVVISADLKTDANGKPIVPADSMAQEEHEADPEPQTSTSGAGARQGGGRSGKQDRLREIGNDDKASSSDRGWIASEQNQISSGNRSSIRVPPGKNLAHRRGKEARKGYNYSHSDLQDEVTHKTQHRVEKKKKKDDQ